MIRFVWATIALLIVGCGKGEMIDSPNAVSGKGDAVSRLCRDANLPDDCAICEVRNWIGDGECDDYCPKNFDPDCNTNTIRVSCMDGFGHIEGSLRINDGQLRLDEAPFIASGMNVDLQREIRENEGETTFAKYGIVEPANPNGDRYDYISVPKSLFDGTLQPTFVAYIKYTGADDAIRMNGCKATGTVIPAMIDDGDVMKALAHEFSSSFEDRYYDSVWKELTDDLIIDEAPAAIVAKLNALIAAEEDADEFWYEMVYEIERNDQTLGYAISPDKCNSEECEAGGSLYVDQNGDLVANHLHDY